MCIKFVIIIFYFSQFNRFGKGRNTYEDVVFMDANISFLITCQPLQMNKLIHLLIFYQGISNNITYLDVFCYFTKYCKLERSQYVFFLNKNLFPIKNHFRILLLKFQNFSLVYCYFYNYFYF